MPSPVDCYAVLVNSGLATRLVPITSRKIATSGGSARHSWLTADTKAATPTATEKPLTEMCLMYLATLTPSRMPATPNSHVLAAERRGQSRVCVSSYP